MNLLTECLEDLTQCCCAKKCTRNLWNINFEIKICRNSQQYHTECGAYDVATTTLQPPSLYPLEDFAMGPETRDS